MDDRGDQRDLARLRVLGFCDHFSDRAGGGAEIVARHVYRYLIEQGAEVLVVSPVPGQPTSLRSVDGIPVRAVAAHDLSRFLNAQVTTSRQLSRVARTAVREFKPDVLHASSIHFRSSLTAAVRAKRDGVPLVTTGHLGAIDRLPRVTKLATAAYEHTASRFILRASERVTAVSTAVARHLIARGADPDRLTVIPNGVDRNTFFPQPSASRPKQVAFIGRLIDNKGPMTALQAFADLDDPEATLVFAGEGPMRTELEGEVRARKLQGSVKFLGHTGDVGELLRSSAVLLRPSLTEGQSLAILEAMASGTGVITTDIPANRELVGSEAGILVPVGDQARLSRHLRRLLQDEGLRDRITAAALDKVALFTWEECGRRTAEVLVQAAARTARTL